MDQLLMTQKERDRLVALKEAQKRLITRKETAVEMGVIEWHVTRLLRSLQKHGGRAVFRGSRNRSSKWKVASEAWVQARATLSKHTCQGFGLTQAAGYFAKKHHFAVRRQILRGWTAEAKPRQIPGKRRTMLPQNRTVLFCRDQEIST